MAQEALHSLKVKNLPGTILKLDLSKAYDRVSWLYLKMLLIPLGFNIGFIRWIMGCVTSTTFVVLINGAPSPFFKAERGLRQGCSLSPLLFLLVAEGLSKFLIEAVRRRELSELKLAPGLNLTHMSFVDDILLFCRGSRRDIDCLLRGLNLFKSATGMVINFHKSSVPCHGLLDVDVRYMRGSLPIHVSDISEGIKYLGFFLKPNGYRKVDWKWLVGKLEKRLIMWSNKWLLRAGCLTLVKLVLEAIPVYWMSIAWISKGVLDRIRRICFSFLWQGKNEVLSRPWVKWDHIAVPRALGGWGLKNVHRFSTALAAKCGWRLLSSESLWTEVIMKKYIASDSLVDWVRCPQKTFSGGSIFWKAILKSFPLIEGYLAWRIGDGYSVRIGQDPWPRSGHMHILPRDLRIFLFDRGIFHLY